jgi:hypothetical protein
MQGPSRGELERLFEEDIAGSIHFTESVYSWSSLRVLDFLYTNEPSTTGEIARGVNMDMRDVRDRLDALNEWDIILENENGWETAANEIKVTLVRNEGLEMSCEVIPQKRESNKDSSAYDKLPSEAESRAGEISVDHAEEKGYIRRILNWFS